MGRQACQGRRGQSRAGKSAAELTSIHGSDLSFLYGLYFSTQDNTIVVAQFQL